MTNTTSPARVERIGLIAKARLHEAGALLNELAAWLESRGVHPIFEHQTAALAGVNANGLEADKLPEAVDMVLVLGGDGTLLAMAGRIAEAGTNIPILGVNFGGLGFLTEITLPELYPSLDAAISGLAPHEERRMLQAKVDRGTMTIASRVVLNDVVLTRGSVSRMIDLSVWVADQFVARFKADGLIVASATGSTAYNLAAGGPILHPAVDALILTPIAPHTLTNRPIVIPGSAVIRVQPLVDGSDAVYSTFDGQSNIRLDRDDIVYVSHAPHPLRLIRATTRSYFEVLRQKLRWAER